MWWNYFKKYQGKGTSGYGCFKEDAVCWMTLLNIYNSCLLH